MSSADFPYWNRQEESPSLLSSASGVGSKVTVLAILYLQQYDLRYFLWCGVYRNFKAPFYMSYVPNHATRKISSFLNIPTHLRSAVLLLLLSSSYYMFLFAGPLKARTEYSLFFKNDVS